ncbi:MAG: TylF/MycF/NovP-related O-methyltransferase [Variibacter sp.]
MNVKYQLKRMARHALVPLLYRYPPFALTPERLYLFLHHLVETKDVPGAVIEIGCNLGGTAVIAKQMMDRLGIDKPYICIDTFDGFIEEQFAADVALGTPAGDETMFSGNSKELVAKIMKRHRAGDIALVQGDVMQIPDRLLPDQCSVVLLDVDLTEPSYVALNRFWPRLMPGGAILVDDCQESCSWKARLGYSRFCEENGIAQEYRYGMGLLYR